MYIKLSADPEREESREAIRKFEEHFEYAQENYYAPQK